MEHCCQHFLWKSGEQNETPTDESRESGETDHFAIMWQSIYCTLWCLPHSGQIAVILGQRARISRKNQKFPASFKPDHSWKQQCVLN